MEGVKAGHAVVETKEVLELIKVFVEARKGEHAVVSLATILDRFNEQEYKPAGDANSEVADNTFVVALLSLGYSHSRREAGEKQHGGVETSKPNIEVFARIMKLSQVVIPHDSKAAEHYREKQNLSCKEEPHTELGSSVSRDRIHVVDMGRLPWWHVVINDGVDGD